MAPLPGDFGGEFKIETFGIRFLACQKTYDAEMKKYWSFFQSVTYQFKLLCCFFFYCLINVPLTVVSWLSTGFNVMATLERL